MHVHHCDCSAAATIFANRTYFGDTLVYVTTGEKMCVFQISLDFEMEFGELHIGNF
jgi:hypothetical protein